jgi:hypothetical protein
MFSSVYSSLQPRVRDAKGTHNLVFNAIGLAPGTHHKGIIEGEDSDDINAFALDFLQGLDVSW